MDTILADYSVSISEFKKNPAEIIRNAGESPVAVLSHNRPAFYMVSPKVFEAMLEEISDKELIEKVRTRLKDISKAVEVNVDEI